MKREPGYRPMDTVVFVSIIVFVFILTSVQTDWGKETLRWFGIDANW